MALSLLLRVPVEARVSPNPWDGVLARVTPAAASVESHSSHSVACPAGLCSVWHSSPCGRGGIQDEKWAQSPVAGQAPGTHMVVRSPSFQGYPPRCHHVMFQAPEFPQHHTLALDDHGKVPGADGTLCDPEIAPQL